MIYAEASYDGLDPLELALICNRAREMAQDPDHKRREGAMQRLLLSVPVVDRHTVRKEHEAKLS